MLNDIQTTSDYMSRWVVLKRRVGAVTSRRVLKVLFYVNILQCFFVVENFTANAVSDMAFSMLASYNVIYSCSLFFFVHYIICPSFYDLSDVVVVIV